MIKKIKIVTGFIIERWRSEPSPRYRKVTWKRYIYILREREGERERKKREVRDGYNDTSNKILPYDIDIFYTSGRPT